MNVSQASLPELETLCTALYTASDPNLHRQSQQILTPLSDSPEYIPQCQLILENSHNEFALLFASTALTKLITAKWGSFENVQRLAIRNFALTYLGNNGPALSSFLCSSLMKLVCRISKLGWYEDAQYRDVVDSVSKFLSASVDHCRLGLNILRELTNEMNQPLPSCTLTYHRKIAVSFRDNALFNIFQLSLNTLKQVVSSGDVGSGYGRIDSVGPTVASPAKTLLPSGPASRVRDAALSLSLACLSYDFVGTCPDESVDDVTAIQVPTAWRSEIEDANLIDLFFRVYDASAGEETAETTTPSAKMCMQCLVQLASVRRSLFSSDAERVNYLSRFMKGTLDVLSRSRGLMDASNVHEFCILLSRMKGNYQLAELVDVEGYNGWLEQLTHFTIKIFKLWQWTPNSLYYLLMLWSRLVASLPYLKTSSSFLENFVPQIVQAFVQTRLDSVCMVQNSEQMDDPLRDEAQLSEYLDPLPVLCRFHYTKFSEFFIPFLDRLVEQFRECVRSADPDSDSVELLEGQLTWMVYVIGAVVGGRASGSGGEAHELIDGDLTCRVFQIMQISNNRLSLKRPNEGDESLELLDESLLYFFQKFRTVYIGEQTLNSNKVYVPLSEQLGLSDYLHVLNIIVSKVILNLELWYCNQSLVQKTLNLLADLCSNYSGAKALLKLDTVIAILGNHDGKQFRFLGFQENFRFRTLFYTTLSRLLFMIDDSAQYRTFIQSFTIQGNEFSTLSSAEEYRYHRERLIGFFLDLQGVVSSTANSRMYNLVFDWIYPQYTPILIRCAEVFAYDPVVTGPLLKLLAELSLNKCSRLTFHPSSVNGLLLFKEVSKVLCTYGQQILLSPGSLQSEDLHKGIRQSSTILSRTMLGNYVNFGVFEMYNDDCFRSVLNVVLCLSMLISVDDIMSYPKVTKAVLGFVEVLVTNHTAVVARLDSPKLMHIMTCLEQGIQSLDSGISSQSAASLDVFTTFYHTNVSLSTEVGLALSNHLFANPDLFRKLFVTLFTHVIFEDCQTLFSLSRPLFSLILVLSSEIDSLIMAVAASQSADRASIATVAFHKLIHDVELKHCGRNRDKFTQNLSQFKHEMKNTR